MPGNPVKNTSVSLGILYLKRCIASDGPWSVAVSRNGNSLNDRLLDTLTPFVKDLPVSMGPTWSLGMSTNLKQTKRFFKKKGATCLAF